MAHNATIILTPPIERIDFQKKLFPKNDESVIILPVMSFDTCDRWRAGFMKALELNNQGPYYLWSADFDFTEAAQEAALALLNYKGKEDFVVGTIKATGIKESIDQIATLPLINHWFPDFNSFLKTQGFTKPRSELFRISHFLVSSTLQRRWYPTEQTINLLLYCFVNNISTKALLFDNLQDAPESRNNPNVVEQVDRMELWLKYMWREQNESRVKSDYTSLSKDSAKLVEKANKTLLSEL